MDILEEHYYTILNIILLKALGIWPHDESRLVLLQRILVIVLTVTHTGLQLSIFLTTRYSVALFVKTMSSVLPCIIIILLYCTFMLRLKSIKNLHLQILEDWKIIRDELEHGIMRKHTYTCRIIVSLTYLFNILGLIVAGCLQLFPLALDFLFPMEEHRPRKLLVKAEYFVPEEKYFFILLGHELVIALLYWSITFATGTQLFVLMYHSFGMFHIASHRLEFFITAEDYLLNISDFNKERIICKKIMEFVTAHRRAMEFCDILIACFNASFCAMAIFGVLSLSINLYRFVEALSISKNFEDMIISYCAIIAHLGYLFAGIFMGQKLSDCNKEINRLTYNTLWYLMPVSSQKLIKFLLQKSGKDFYLTIGFLLSAKVENFTAFVNTALSYVAVMYSVQSETVVF